MNIFSVSNDPYIYYIDNFLTDKECNTMIKDSKTNLKPAAVSIMDNEIDKFKPGVYKGRNNSSYWMPHNNSKTSQEILKRVSKFLECDPTHFENFQIIHYGPSEHYDYHYDAYDINDKEKYNKFCGNIGNRILTVLVYLNDVEEGGETGFDNLSFYGSTVKISAKKGRMVVFYNLNKDGTINIETRHAGLPILKGEKWAFNLWLRENSIN